MIKSSIRYTEEQDKERYTLLNIPYEQKDSGGIIKFKELSSDTLKKLIDKGYCEEDKRQNFSPTAKSFYEFLKTTEGFLAHGYLVINNREDRRISIEGLEYHGSDVSTAKTTFESWFADLTCSDEYVESPDEYMIYDDYIWIWWD